MKNITKIYILLVSTLTVIASDLKDYYFSPHLPLNQSPIIYKAKARTYLDSENGKFFENETGTPEKQIVDQINNLLKNIDVKNMYTDPDSSEIAGIITDFSSYLKNKKSKYSNIKFMARVNALNKDRIMYKIMEPNNTKFYPADYALLEKNGDNYLFGNLQKETDENRVVNIIATAFWCWSSEHYKTTFTIPSETLTINLSDTDTNTKLFLKLSKIPFTLKTNEIVKFLKSFMSKCEANTPIDNCFVFEDDVEKNQDLLMYSSGIKSISYVDKIKEYITNKYDNAKSIGVINTPDENFILLPNKDTTEIHYQILCLKKVGNELKLKNRTESFGFIDPINFKGKISESIYNYLVK